MVDASPTNQYHGRVTLREKPSTKSRGLTRLPRGALVLTLGEEKGMIRVALPGYTGYVARKHIAPVKAVETTLVYVNNDAPVSLRLDSRYGEQWVITTLESGTPVQLIRNPNGWAQVEAAGYRGRMVAEYLSEEKP